MEAELSEMRATLARIDERTAAMQEGMKTQNDALEQQKERSRQDLKEVNERINRVERRQNWFLGIGSAFVFIIAVITKLFDNLFGGQSGL